MTVGPAIPIQLCTPVDEPAGRLGHLQASVRGDEIDFVALLFIWTPPGLFSRFGVEVYKLAHAFAEGERDGWEPVDAGASGPAPTHTFWRAIEGVL